MLFYRWQRVWCCSCYVYHEYSSWTSCNWTWVFIQAAFTRYRVTFRTFRIGLVSTIWHERHTFYDVFTRHWITFYFFLHDDVPPRTVRQIPVDFTPLRCQVFCIALEFITMSRSESISDFTRLRKMECGTGVPTGRFGLLFILLSQRNDFKGLRCHVNAAPIRYEK